MVLFSPLIYKHGKTLSTAASVVLCSMSYPFFLERTILADPHRHHGDTSPCLHVHEPQLTKTHPALLAPPRLPKRRSPPPPIHRRHQRQEALPTRTRPRQNQHHIRLRPRILVHPRHPRPLHHDRRQRAHFPTHPPDRRRLSHLRRARDGRQGLEGHRAKRRLEADAEEAHPLRDEVAGEDARSRPGLPVRQQAEARASG